MHIPFHEVLGPNQSKVVAPQLLIVGEMERVLLIRFFLRMRWVSVANR